MFKPIIRKISDGGLLTAAAIHRQLFRQFKLVGITGSVGKTTTAVLVSAVLGKRGPEHSTNLRAGHNYIQRAALTIVGTRPVHGYYVAEFTGDRPGAMGYASRYLRPDVGIVTHIKSDHYTNFRSLEATAVEKGQLISCLPENGLAILNTDDEHVWRMRKHTRARVIGCGANEQAELRLKNAHADWPDRLSLEIEYQGSAFSVRTRLLGEYAIFPVLAALATGVSAGIPLSEAVSAIEAVEPIEGRMSQHVTARRRDGCCRYLEGSTPFLSIDLIVSAFCEGQAENRRHRNHIGFSRQQE